MGVDELACALEARAGGLPIVTRATARRRAHQLREQSEYEPLDREVGRVIAVVQLPLELAGEAAHHAVVYDSRPAKQSPDSSVVDGGAKRHIDDRDASAGGIELIGVGFLGR